MALQLNYTNQYGDVWEESFWYVASFSVDRDNKIARFVLNGFKDADAYASRKVNTLLNVPYIGTIRDEEFDAAFTPYALDATTPYKAIYQHVMSLPEFEGAIEVPRPADVETNG